MTTNTELNEKLSFLSEYMGAFPCDRLPRVTKYPAALILNTDPSTKPGEHWVAVYIDSKKCGIYFDPYGFEPLLDVFKQFLDNNCLNGWTYSSKLIQSIKSINCGRYCYMFIILRAMGFPLSHIHGLFDKNPDINDLIVNKYYKFFD